MANISPTAAKFPVKIAACAAVCIVCCLFGEVKAQFNDDLVYHYSGAPFASFRVQVDPLEPRSIVLADAAISNVLRDGGLSEIATPVVQPVSVDVVDDHARHRGRDNAMHVCGFATGKVPDSIFLASHTEKMPVELPHEWQVASVDNGEFSPRKGDKGLVAFHADWSYFSGSHSLILHRSGAVRVGRGVQPSRPANDTAICPKPQELGVYHR